MGLGWWWWVLRWSAQGIKALCPTRICYRLRGETGDWVWRREDLKLTHLLGWPTFWQALLMGFAGGFTEDAC